MRKCIRVVSTVLMCACIFSFSSLVLLAESSPMNEEGIIQDIQVTEYDKEPILQMSSGTSAQVRAWLYSEEIQRQTIYSLNATIDATRYVSVYLGFEDPHGKPYFATGTLQHTGTVWYQPSATEKIAIYTGTVSCYIF